jgi:hypothetical protein
VTVEDLVQWLRAQYDEDERIAREADPDLSNLTGCVEIEYPEIKADEEHALRHRPARVLRDIDAKRDLLRFAEGVHDHHETFTAGVAARLEVTLRLLALPYADRPGYREEWRP